MAFTTLYAIWLDAYKRKALPNEWRRAGDFLHWATKNGYKAQYGYKGEFSPEGCLAVIPASRTAAEELADKYSLSVLKEIAVRRGIPLGQAKTKKDIASLLVEENIESEASHGHD